MRLQCEGASDSSDCRLRQAQFLGHRPGAPMRSVLRLGLECARDDCFNGSVVDRARRARARRVGQSIQPKPSEAASPLRHRLLSHFVTRRDGPIIQSLGTIQDVLGAQCKRLSGLPATSPCCQLRPLSTTENDRRRWSAFSHAETYLGARRHARQQNPHNVRTSNSAH